MNERAYNCACENENARESEWQAMPKELRDFLRPPRLGPVAHHRDEGLVILHIGEPSYEVVGYPSFTFFAAIGDAQQFVHIDAALVLSVYREGGIMAAYRFILTEASAALEGMAEFIKENPRQS